MTDRHPQPPSLPIDMLADQIKRSHIISHHTKLPHQQQKWGQDRQTRDPTPTAPGGLERDKAVFGTRGSREVASTIDGGGRDRGGDLRNTPHLVLSTAC